MKCPQCDTPIDEHEASRCLDAWVAEAVMGAIAFRPGKYATHDYGDKWFLEAEYPNFPGKPMPYYSTYIAAAWGVVEKMGFYQLGSYQKGNVPVSHWAEFKDLVMEADTAQLAICRAALKAAGND